MAYLGSNFIAGPRLVDGSDLNSEFGKVADSLDGTDTSTPTFTSEDAVTAHAGGGQASATLLTGVVNRVSTVATAADSVKLPASKAGLVIWVVNGAAANSMQVFGTSPDTINGAATGTGVAQAAGKSAAYICPVAGKWFQLLSA